MTQICCCSLAALLSAAPRSRTRPIKIGLVTALSGQSARAGEAITRGLQVAIDEINAKGGMLRRPQVRAGAPRRRSRRRPRA